MKRNESACCGNCPWPAYYPDAECHLCRRGDWCEILLDHPACPAHPDFWQEETPVAVETLAEACARGDVSGQIRDVEPVDLDTIHKEIFGIAAQVERLAKRLKGTK